MTLNKLDTSGLNRSQLADPYGVNRSRPDENSSGTVEPVNNLHVATNQDHADISDNARKLVDLKKAVDTGRAALELLPEVRTDKVAQVKERLASGFYQSAEVRDNVAARLTSLVMEGGLF